MGAMKQTLVLGGPGAGKTTRLLAVMEAALDAGTPPERVAFVSFTTAAVNEAKTRAIEKFGFDEKQLPYFRTSHSLAFRELGLNRNDVLGNKHLEELAELTGELFTPARYNAEDGPAAGMSADPLLTLDHYARTTLQTLREAWGDHGGELDWFRLKRFVDAYRAYRTDKGLVDFTDMLERYSQSASNPIPVDLAIIDEGQDFTLLQWRVALKAFEAAAELWVAGDDLQSIHHWAGAAEDYFLSLGYDRQTLPLSHRLPKAIFDLATQQAGRVSRKYPRQWTHNGRQGAVNWYASPDEVSLARGTWLLLARTRAQLGGLVALAQEQGVLYRLKGASSVDKAHVAAIQAHEALRAGKPVYGHDAAAVLKAAGRSARGVIEEAVYTAAELGYDASPIWHDALVGIPLETREYYLACMRRGEKLTQEPRVRIETIHGAKGTEAEHVLLLTDLTYRVQRGMEIDPDAEARVFYVGLTRARETLNLVMPQTQYGYPL
jgi:DNA helicase-2/ATP-dependent DNA helicase PcrA